MKIHGFVESLGQPWTARLRFPGEHYYDSFAEMKEPLPLHAREGSFFTIHQPKRGQPYFYWITKPLITKRRLKKARIWARKVLNSINSVE